MLAGAGATVQASLWDSGAAGPEAPVTLSVDAFATDPRFVASGHRAWIVWLEGRSDRSGPTTLAQHV